MEQLSEEKKTLLRIEMMLSILNNMDTVCAGTKQELEEEKKKLIKKMIKEVESLDT